MPDDPLNELTVRNGVMMYVAPSLAAVEYLATPPIAIVAKWQLVQLAGGEVSYMFALNDRADLTWIDLFTTHLDDLHAEIQGAQIEIRCKPTDLENMYAKAKALVALTNRNYSEYKAQLTRRVADLDVERQLARRVAEEKTRSLQAQFDRLEL